MNKKVAEMLVKELRSGFWEQGKLFLEHSNTFCVYGVLSNIAATHGICSHSGINIGKFDNEMLVVPDSVVKWAQLNSTNGYLKKLKYSLIEMNDRGTSFSKLADIIEKNWEDL